MSRWGRDCPWRFWGPEIRERVANDAAQIGHWRVIEGEYESAPHIEATWFVDPPYCGATKASRYTGGGPVVTASAGDRYRFGAKRIDFGHLATWCRMRRGQTIVCEGPGADWLPFRPFGLVKGQSGTSPELVWLSDWRGQEPLPAEHAETCDMGDDCTCTESA